MLFVGHRDITQKHAINQPIDPPGAHPQTRWNPILSHPRSEPHNPLPPLFADLHTPIEQRSPNNYLFYPGEEGHLGDKDKDHNDNNPQHPGFAIGHVQGQGCCNQDDGDD